MKTRTLQQLIDDLNQIGLDNPELLNKPVVYARDDEGNGYAHVYFSPTPGHFDEGEFETEDQIRKEEMKIELNCVCVN